MSPIRFLFICLIFISYSLQANTLTVAAVGDILLHSPLQKKGLKQGFKSLWAPVIPLLRQADIAYANLEGPVAPGFRHSSFPMFNYPAEVLPALKQSGIDIVSTANNHSLDKFHKGIDKTIDELRAHELLFSGTRKRHSKASWATQIAKNGITTAWIACTQDTNGIDDKYQQVLYCYKDKKSLLTLIKQLKTQVDAVIITPHWGQQYRLKPSKRQRTLAKQLLNAGALIIIGSHPHCLQPIERYKTIDGRDGLIAYSMGNFISNQGSLKNRVSGVLWLQLKKSPSTTFIEKLRFSPTIMENRGRKMQLKLAVDQNGRVYRYLKKKQPEISLLVQ